MLIKNIIRKDEQYFKARAAEHLLLAVYELEKAKLQFGSISQKIKSFEIQYNEALAIERAVAAILADRHIGYTDKLALKAWLFAELEETVPAT